jgi:hypothetical protein
MKIFKRKKIKREKYIKKHKPIKEIFFITSLNGEIIKYGWFDEGIGWERI